MAKMGANGILTGMLGGRLVFRRVGNETIVQCAPKRRKRQSEAQQKLRERFREAAWYARGMMGKPAIKEAYALWGKHRTAYHSALSDFLNAPAITAADCTRYTGRPGDAIRICAVDDFKVTKVLVQIIAANGMQVESGNATAEPNGLEWVYTTTALNDSLSSCRIIIKAYDMPGNEAVQEIALSQ